MSQNIIEANDGNFDPVVLQADGPVLVDFWAEWCGPCRRLAPTIEAVAVDYTTRARVVKLNVDAGPATARRYGIQGIPTLILFRDGAEKERIVGAASKEAISALIDRHLSALPDSENRSENRKVG
ncbi:MAG TPA: thioredoxin [Candidatus Binatia bacterium]|jgi:thioredoxin 1